MDKIPLEYDLLMTLCDKLSTYMLYFMILYHLATNSDKETGVVAHPEWLCAMWFTLFTLDFTANWFTLYSRLLAGNRTSVVQNKLEEIILAPTRSIIGYSIVDVLTRFWLFFESIAIMVGNRENYQIVKIRDESELFQFVTVLLSSFGVYKAICNLIYLKQGFYRIIDLDVEERNAKAARGWLNAPT